MQRGDAIVVVDVLSFSSAVVTAVDAGARVRPCSDRNEALELAARNGGAVAVPRPEVPQRGRYSLSPRTLCELGPGQRLFLPPPNGGACCALGTAAPLLMAGALRNAGAVARAADRFLATHTAALTVIACGEQWPDPAGPGELRFALEDYLGAGAICACLDGELLSCDARVAAAALRQARGELGRLLLDCESGQELSERGFASDVAWSAQLDCSEAVPVLKDGWFSDERLSR